MDLIEMHSSWLVINSIIGCPNACKYCFLQSDGNNSCLPVFKSTPEEAVKELIEFKYYDETLPLCLFPNTDIFLNERTIEYLTETLDELMKRNIKNDIVLITKCLIPDYVLKKLRNIIDEGIKVVVYLSYSGLSKEMEPNINHEDIKQNFKNLKSYGIPIIHYYRPFMKENSSKEKIKEVLNFVNKYTNVSAIMGLMYVPSLIEKQDYWEDLSLKEKEEIKNSVSIWPKDAWDYFYKEYDSKGNFYQINSCALNTILEKPSQYYGTYECKNYNHCSKEQRKRCELYKRKINNKRILIKELSDLLIHIGINTRDYYYKYDRNKGIELYGISLEVKTLAYLSHMLGIKVTVPKREDTKEKYNSTLNNSKPFIIGGTNEKSN